METNGDFDGNSLPEFCLRCVVFAQFFRVASGLIKRRPVYHYARFTLPRLENEKKNMLRIFI